MEQPAEEERERESMVGIPKETNARKIQLVLDRSGRTAVRWNRDMQKWNLRKTCFNHSRGGGKSCVEQRIEETLCCVMEWDVGPF